MADGNKQKSYECLIWEANDSEEENLIVKERRRSKKRTMIRKRMNAIDREWRTEKGKEEELKKEGETEWAEKNKQMAGKWKQANERKKRQKEDEWKPRKKEEKGEQKLNANNPCASVHPSRSSTDWGHRGSLSHHFLVGRPPIKRHFYSFFSIARSHSRNTIVYLARFVHYCAVCGN